MSSYGKPQCEPARGEKGAGRAWRMAARAGATDDESDAFALTESAAAETAPLSQLERMPRLPPGRAGSRSAKATHGPEEGGAKPPRASLLRQHVLGASSDASDPWALPCEQREPGPATARGGGGSRRGGRARRPPRARLPRRYPTAAQRRAAAAQQQVMCPHPANRTKARAWRLQTDVRAQASVSVAPAELCWVEPCSAQEAARLRRGAIALTAAVADAPASRSGRAGHAMSKVVSSKLPPRARTKRPRRPRAPTGRETKARGGAATDAQTAKEGSADGGVGLSTPDCDAVKQRTPAAPRGRKQARALSPDVAPDEEGVLSCTTAMPTAHPAAGSIATSSGSALDSWGRVFNTPRPGAHH